MSRSLLVVSALHRRFPSAPFPPRRLAQASALVTSLLCAPELLAQCKNPTEWVSAEALGGDIATLFSTDGAPMNWAQWLGVAENGWPGATPADYSKQVCGSPGDQNITASSHGGDGGPGNSGNLVQSGGDGGNGGNGGRILVGLLNNAASMNLVAGNRDGISAISIGGNGGSGGASGALGGGGGAGGRGGNGGQVALINVGNITTTQGPGKGMYGVSQGGLGAVGGGGGWFSSGGSGGTAGESGTTVAAFNMGSIRTLEGESDGIYLHSLGGNGGEGGVSKGAFVAIGGSGGDGGAGGTAQGWSRGHIATDGNQSEGLAVHSIGGGGGDGGDAHSGGAFASVAIGGSGGGGGPGALAKGNNSGTITTSGRKATGMRVQSIGGGGGNGGNSQAIAAGVSLSFAMSVGGSGGHGGDGGEAHGSNYSSYGGALEYGNIVTGQYLATNWFPAHADWGDLDALYTDGNDAPGDYAPGMLVQSIGGGGGSGGSAFTVSAAVGTQFALASEVSIGGTGGSGGNGGNVALNNLGASVATYGRNAPALQAQSSGGGGGDGGSIFSVAASAARMSGNASVNIGGSGESGGDGGIVTVQTGKTLSTVGASSPTVQAQSIGGGGGSGGTILDIGAGVGASALTVGVNLGGSGGVGGSGGSVQINGGTTTASNLTNISTYGDRADGILAQSIGGGGGTGGTINTYGVSAQLGPGGVAGTVTVNLGGSGGSGGVGGEVLVGFDGQLTTVGAASSGVKAQSLGGGGGDAGSIYALAVSASLNRNDSSGPGALTATVGLGASGGTGNHGGTVTTSLGLSTPSSISTQGERAFGVQAQSIGGGGGSGSTVHSWSMATSLPSKNGIGNSSAVKFMAHQVGDPSAVKGGDTQTNFTLTANLGGSGGAAGDGGATTVDLGSGRIATSGGGSHAVLAQSIGGGGGSGGNAVSNGFVGVGTYDLNFGMGGRGAGGGNGGTVIVGSTRPGTTPTAATTGSASYGVLAQSVGGGGGEGGSSMTSLMDYTTLGGTNVTVNLGGSGGTAGNGGDSHFFSGARVNTSGDNAVGVLLQSIGGGGGVANAATTSGKIVVAIGGDGGAAGNGGKVNAGYLDITTRGSNAVGLLAQSIGGGGGTAGSDAVDGGLTSGASTIAVTIGGQGGQGGNGGAVNVGCADVNLSRANCGGAITTHGDVAHGIVAQSIGGGGGVSQSSSVDLSIFTIPFTLHGAAGSGSSGLVTVQDADNSNLNIQTNGEGAIGIIAQSISNGGGSLLLDTNSQEYTLDYRGASTTGGGGSNGGIEVSYRGDLSTRGTNAHGMYLQSLSGAHTVFDTTRALLHGGFSTAADGKIHAVTSASASISTSGFGAHGIVGVSHHNSPSSTGPRAFAQHYQLAGSINVTGSHAWGLWALNGGAQAATSTSDIVVDLGADILSGANAAGAMYLENHNGENTVTVTNVGKLRTGRVDANCPATGDCAVLQMKSDFWNSLTVQSGGTVSGGTAIFNGPNNTVQIDGLLQGIPQAASVHQPSYVRQVLRMANSAGATGSSTIGVGATGRVYGAIDTQGVTANTVSLTNRGYIEGSVTGNTLRYSNYGTHVLNVSGTGAPGDSINVAAFDNISAVTSAPPARVQVQWTSLPVQSGLANTRLISTALTTPGNAGNPATLEVGDVRGVGLATQLVVSRQTDATRNTQWLQLDGVTIDFGVTGVTGILLDAAALASVQVHAIETGDSSFHPNDNQSVTEGAVLYNMLMDMANTNDSVALTANLAQFNTQAHYSAEDSSLASASYAHNHLQSCGGGDLASINPISQGECNWAKVVYEENERKNGLHEDRNWGLNIGRQVALNDTLYAGFSAGYGLTDFTGSNTSQEGERLTLGGIVKFVDGSRFASASMLLGYQWAEGQRSLVAGSTALTGSDHDTWVLSARLRGGYQFGSERFGITPMLDLNVPVVYDRGYREHGGGAFNMEVLSSTNVVPDLHPAVQFGSHFKTGGASIRAFTEIGARFRFNDVKADVRMPNGFAVNDVTRLEHTQDREMLTWGAGFLVDWNERLETRVVYEGERGDTSRSSTGSVKFAWKF
jgi:hypothetical protein